MIGFEDRAAGGAPAQGVRRTLELAPLFLTDLLELRLEIRYAIGDVAQRFSASARLIDLAPQRFHIHAQPCHATLSILLCDQMTSRLLSQLPVALGDDCLELETRRRVVAG